MRGPTDSMSPPAPVTGLAMAVGMAALLALGATAALAAEQPRLGTAANYAVMAGTTITNTGPTVVNGNLALSPGSAVVGFPPGVVTGEPDVMNADAVLAQTDLVTAYNDAAAAITTETLTGTDLGGLTLTPGVYTFSSSAQLTGTLTLDGQGSTNATFIFQIGSTLTTASASRVELINGAGGCAVYWQVGSSATLGTMTAFQGTIMALQSITMNTGATIGVGGIGNGGRALARNAALTLDTNVITPPPPGCTFAAAPGASESPTTAPSESPATTPTGPTASAPTTGTTVTVASPTASPFLPNTRTAVPLDGRSDGALTALSVALVVMTALMLTGAARRQRR